MNLLVAGETKSPRDLEKINLIIIKRKEKRFEKGDNYFNILYICIIYNIMENKGEELMEASRRGNVEAVDMLISEGANVNYKDDDGRSPLHAASINGHAEVVEMLISKGANVNYKDNNGRSPLHVASVHGHVDVVKLLLSKGANVNDKDKNGWSPLFVASFFGHVEVESILEKWPHSMGVISLENLNLHNDLWKSKKYLYEIIGTNKDGSGRNKKSKRFRKKKSNNNKKKRKTIRKRR